MNSSLFARSLVMDVTFDDADISLDRIYDNIHHGFLGILAVLSGGDEKICVVSIGKIGRPIVMHIHFYT